MVTSKLDSLENSIHVSNLKIDSLEKIVHNAVIGKGYFSEIIYLQLTVFVVIIGLISIISLKYFNTRIKNESLKNRKYLIKCVKRIKKDLDKSIEQGLVVSYDSSRAMYHISYKDKQYFYSFIWAINSFLSNICLENHLNKNEDNLDVSYAKNWLIKALDSLEKLDSIDKSEMLENKLDKYIETLKIWEDDVDISEITNKIIDTIFKKRYSN